MARRVRIAALLFLAALATVTGCTVSDRDVSDDAHFRVGYLPGQVYRLAQPATLLRIDRDYFELVPPGVNKAYGRPAGTLAAGETIEIISLRHTVAAAPIQWETGVTTEARVVSHRSWTVALDSISGVHWVSGDCGIRTGVLTPESKWLVLVGTVSGGE
jgi:hypothetical protein